MNGRATTAADKRLLTYRQVAELLSVDIRTVRRMRSAGRLRPVVLGRRCVRFRPDEVERLIRKGSV